MRRGAGRPSLTKQNVRIAADHFAPSPSSSNVWMAFFGWRAGSRVMRRFRAASAGFHITVFELSYQERAGWNGAEHGWLWAHKHQEVEQEFHRERID